MNAPPPLSPLARVETAPRDPILGLTEAFNADKNPAKVNLGVGVYYDDAGKVPLLQCIRRAEAQLAEQAAPRSYLPIDGLAAYDRAVQALLFGSKNAALREGRILTVQALGGTGALKVGADFLKRLIPNSTIWISEPSWENHRALFEAAGFPVKNYPYYDAATRAINFSAMLDTLRGLAADSIVVLHACCHNPTGVDLTQDQWTEVIAIVVDRGLIPFLDIAYQGFDEGIELDAAVVRRFAEAGGPLFVSSSFSKSFSLYGERVGALSVVAANDEEAQRVLSQVKRVIRTNYSNPPTHGGQVVATVLANPELRALWETELTSMRDRVHAMRRLLMEKIETRLPGVDYSFVTRQRGIFSYSGLSKAAVERLRREFAIYAVDTGRICVAALNSNNIDYIADSMAKVMKSA